MPTILVVEDNEMNLDMLVRRLERRKFTVLIAMDGARGVELARREIPDLILMDMSLPVLDGWQATRQIRSLAETRHIPIIALTAHALAGDREKCIAAGANEYETKPVKFQRLLEKIELLLPS